MLKLLRQGNFRIAIFIFLATLLLYLPVIKNPSVLLSRGNDLEEYYWPIAFFESEHLISDRTLPFWNSMFFSGTPLLPDPQSLLFYPINAIFLVLPTDPAFIVWFMVHTFLAGVGAYLAARKGFGFSRVSSIFTALFYITFPRAAGFAEAGHITLAASIAWLPFVLLASAKLAKSPNFYWMLVWSFSLSILFFLFPTIFAPSLATSLLFVVVCWFYSRARSLRTFKFVFFGLFATIGLIAITLFPQLEWLPQTTRFILLKDRDVYPIWRGVTEFLRAVYPHVFGGRDFIFSLDSEKWIACGIFITVLAFVGFLKLEKKLKALVALLVVIIVFVSLNNISPFHSLLLASDWYVLSRVTTRNWFVIALVVVFLAGFGLEKIGKTKRKNLVLTLGSLSLIELFILSWLRLERPIIKNEEVPQKVYEFLKSDTELFRVFCTTRCLSQKNVALYNLQTIEGYATVYQKNYYDNFISLSQVFWDKYSSTLPPSSVYKFQEIQPIATILGEANVKYVISPYTLNDPQFTKVAQFEKYLIFENTKFRTRAYFYVAGATKEIEAPILKYRPGNVVIDASKHKAGEIVFAETRSSGWKARADGKRLEIEEAGNKLMKVKVEPNTQFVELYYYPESYRLGKAVGILALAVLSYFALDCLTPRRQRI